MVVLLTIIPGLHAAEIEGVTFKDHFTVNGTDLDIRGTGLFRYLKFIKAYVGALYMPSDVASEDVLSDIPKRLEVEYFHAIKGEDFGPATNKVMAQNVDAETFERLKPLVEYHNSLYRDVEPGDRYSLTYIPGEGTVLALNDRPLGTIEGAEFAAAVFSMWLGEKPMNKAFKNQLLRTT
jgi:hypothetical protein